MRTVSEPLPTQWTNKQCNIAEGGQRLGDMELGFHLSLTMMSMYLFAMFGWVKLAKMCTEVLNIYS